jgi:adenylosuccinate synthase
MPNVLVVGAQWGDEGKGRVVDHLAADAAFAVRFGGGANAGHTLVVNGQKVVLHLIPAGALRPGCRGLIGNGCVMSPASLRAELARLAAAGHPLDPGRLGLSPRLHVVTPYHLALDRAEGAAVGTTGRGIGPCYADKVARRGLRLEVLLRGEAAPILAAQRHLVAALHPALELPAVEAVEAELRADAEALAPFVTDVDLELEAAVRRDDKILFEGAQGALLDIDHGTYPFVTSSTTTAGGVASGVGLWVDLHRRVGVTKAYSTRVGHGPYPTEIEGPIGDQIRTKGAEFGSTTGRPRRCGWIDLPALRQAARLNGLTELAVTKIDVLADIPVLRVAVEHGPDGPVYVDLPGFGDVSAARSWDALPPEAQRYLQLIADQVGVPVRIVSVGAERAALMTLPGGTP